MIRYHSVQPEALQNSYKEFDTVDFVLTFEGRRMLVNSLRIKGDVDVYTTGTTRPTTQDIYIDPMIGAHTFVESVQTELQSVGVIENLNEYPRYCRMLADTTMVADDAGNNSENVCELRTGAAPVTQVILRGITSRDNKDTVVEGLDFSIKPKMVLNGGMPGESIPFTRSGAVRITVKLARNAAALFGKDVDAASNYVLKNLQVCYTSVPDDGSKQAVVLRNKLNIKQTIQSQFANVSTKVPAVCTAVSCSFQQLANENALVSNNVQTEVVPNIQEVQYLFNDSTNTYVTYQLKSRSEWLGRYIESFIDTGNNNASLNHLKSNSSFGIGLAFRDQINLSNQKFNVQLTSDISSSQPYVMYLYFHSTVAV